MKEVFSKLGASFEYEELNEHWVFFHKIEYDGTQLKIWLEQNQAIIFLIIFNNPVSFRIGNESYFIGRDITTPSRRFASQIHVTDNSPYLDWYKKNNPYALPVRNYLIMDEEEILDILALNDPEIFKINDPCGDFKTS